MQRKFSTNFAAPKQQEIEPDDAWDFDAPTFFDIKTYHETVQNKHFLDFALDGRVYTDFWFTYPHDYFDDNETENKSKPSTSTSAKESFPLKESRANLSLNTTHKEDNKKKVIVPKGNSSTSTVTNVGTRRMTASYLNPSVVKPQQQCTQTVTHVEMKLQTSTVITQGQQLLPSHKKRKEPYVGVENEYFPDTGAGPNPTQVRDGRRYSYVSKALKFSSHHEETNRRLSVANKNVKIKAFSIVRNSDAHSILIESNSNKLVSGVNRRKSRSLEKFTTTTTTDQSSYLEGSKAISAKPKEEPCTTEEMISQARPAEIKELRSKSVQVFYEPAKFSARHVRKWEKLTNKQWYLLTQQERHDANIQMEQLIKKGLI